MDGFVYPGDGNSPSFEEDYTPLESDFSSAGMPAEGVYDALAEEQVERADHDQAYILDRAERELPSPPPLISIEDMLAPPPRRKSRRNRRTEVPNLPPLPVDVMPPDGGSRFDWRQRALSRLGRMSGGKRWYPETMVERVTGEKSKLTWGDVYHDELENYKKHFLPLLHAEMREEQNLFNDRLREWTVHRLTKDGYAIENLSGSKARWQTSGTGADGNGSVILEFKRLGKLAVNPLPYHRFMSGSAVIISRTDPLEDPVLEDGISGRPGPKKGLLRATVYSVGRGFIRVQCDQPIEGLEQGSWRLDLGLNQWAWHAQIDAIQALNYDPIFQDMADVQRDKEENDRPQPSSVTDIDDMLDLEASSALAARSRKRIPEQTILAGTALRDKLLRAFQEEFVPYESTTALSAAPTKEDMTDGVVIPAKQLKMTDVDAVNVPSISHTSLSGTLVRNELIKSWAIRHRSEGPVVGSDGDPDVPLNPSQLRAIAMMLSERLSLVQGPPGTGKTRVIIEAIKLLKIHWQVPHPVLVTAHTNVAVDNLVAGLRANGVKAVRLGVPERVRADLHDSTFDEMCKEHPLFPQIEMLQSEADYIWTKDQNGNYAHPPNQRKELSKGIRGKLFKLRATMFADVLADADVVCTTCLAAASTFVLKHIDFPMVFLDEASMATEPLSLVPLMKGSSHVAIIGDHKQLPPVIISDVAKAGGLTTSLFERLIHERHVPSIMLDTQYRMHPAISAFPSAKFYNGDLKDGTVTSTGEAVPGFETPISRYLEDSSGRPTSVTFIDHSHPESPEMKSIANHGDAEIITDIVVDLLHNNPDLSGSDIGIIAPYAAQIRALDNKLNADPTVLNAMADVLGTERAMEVGDIEIKTVDGFEGREKQVIVFSTVRSNAAGYIGFLADWRRLNVGVTRAKRGLIMVGSAATLEKARIGSTAEESLPQGGTEVWKEFMAHLREKGAVIRHSL